MTFRDNAQSIIDAIYAVDRDEAKLLIIEDALQCVYEKGRRDLADKINPYKSEIY